MFGERLKILRSEKGISQGKLAQLFNIDRSTVSKWESGDRTPDIETGRALANHFGVSLDYLFGATNDPHQELEMKFYTVKSTGIIQEAARRMEAQRKPLPSNALRIKKVHVPLLGEIAAGEPILADEEKEVYVLSDESLGCDFALQVAGDSMEPRFLDGDIVFFRARDDVDDGQIAAVVIDDTATLKHVYHLQDGVQLISDNPKYPPMIFDSTNSDSVRIIGKAVSFMRKI